MTLAARNTAPATDKLATDELATDDGPELLASKPELVPLHDVDPPKETKSITSSPGTTTIPWWLKAIVKLRHDRLLSASAASAPVRAHVRPNAECFLVRRLSQNGYKCLLVSNW